MQIVWKNATRLKNAGNIKTTCELNIIATTTATTFTVCITLLYSLIDVFTVI